MTLDFKTAFVTLAAADFESVTDFYTMLLERSPHPYIPQSYAEFQLPGLRLGIFRPKQSHRSEFAGQSGNMSLCLEVEHLETAIAHLATLQRWSTAPTSEMMTASHGREIYAYDPIGTRIILHQST